MLTYPDYLQAYDTAHWTGWTRVLGGNGPAFFVSMPDTYLNLRPVASEQPTGGSTSWIGAVVVAGLAVAVAALVWCSAAASGRRKIRCSASRGC